MQQYSRLCAPVSQEALESGCNRLELHTCSWNQTAIHFYKGLDMENTSEKRGRLLFRMFKPEMTKLAKEPKWYLFYMKFALLRMPVILYPNKCKKCHIPLCLIGLYGLGMSTCYICIYNKVIKLSNFQPLRVDQLWVDQLFLTLVWKWPINILKVLWQATVDRAQQHHIAIILMNFSFAR